MMELPEGEFKCIVPAVNKEDTNSCVMQYYQQGLGTFANVCLNDLLGAAMAEPLFKTLRTEYQLGYSVYCMPTCSHGVLGFVLVVECQAHKFRMEKIDEIMTQFVQQFEENLEKMSSDKFLDLLNNQALLRAADDGDLFDESSRFWTEIFKHNYVFNRQQSELKALQEMKHKDLLQWYRNTMLDHKRKLSLMIQGSTSSQVPKPSSFSALPTLNSVIKNLRTCVPNVVKYHPILKQDAFSRLEEAVDALPALPKTGTQHNRLVQPIKEEATGYIRDIKEFKNTLHSLPSHIITK